MHSGMLVGADGQTIMVHTPLPRYDRFRF